jgi:hypothetical protein
MGVDPVNREAIWREQLERAIAFDSLQRPNPGIEMLPGQLVLEGTYAARPECAPHLCCFARRCIHGWRYPFGGAGKKGCEV